MKGYQMKRKQRKSENESPYKVPIMEVIEMVPASNKGAKDEKFLVLVIECSNSAEKYVRTEITPLADGFKRELLNTESVKAMWVI